MTSIADADAKHQDASLQGLRLRSHLSRCRSRPDREHLLRHDRDLPRGVNDRTANYSGNNGLGSDGDRRQRSTTRPLRSRAANTWCRSRQLRPTSWMRSLLHGRGIGDRRPDQRRPVRQHRPLHGRAARSPPGPDQLGGTWTYTVNSIVTADTAHQNAAYTGFVYDLTYFDADNGSTFNTLLRHDRIEHGRQRPHRQLFGQQLSRLRRRPGRCQRLRTSPSASGKYVLPEQTATGR